MISSLYNIIFILVFVFFIFMIESSTCSSLDNSELAQLIERLDRMQTKMDTMRSMEVENAQLTERLDRMQTKMDALRRRDEVLEVENAQLTERLDRMQTKMDAIQSRVEMLEIENNKWDRKFGDLEEESEKLKSQIPNPKFSLSAALKRNDGPISRVLRSPPTSCQELKNQNGLWPMDGIHLLKKQNKIKAAFCTFAADGSPVSEAVIGQVDVTTKTIHFYVQRNDGGFSMQNVVMPFNLARLNEGNAFNLTSGTFTVPVPGIYRFDFSGVKDGSSTVLDYYLQVNGVKVGRAVTLQTAKGSLDVISLSASFRLVAGDRVNLFKFGDAAGELYDYLYSTHFSGWLVEEDLM